MFAVHYYKVHFSVPETPLVSLLCCVTTAGILVFGSSDTKTPVWLACIRNNLIYRQFPSNFDTALKATLRLWRKSDLMSQWRIVISPLKLRWDMKENAATNHIFMSHWVVLYSTSVIPIILQLQLRIFSVKCFTENWFEGHLVLEVQTTFMCNLGCNLDKEAEGYTDKNPEALRLGLAQIQ